MTGSFHFSLPGCALAACLALSGHDAGADTITFDHAIGTVTAAELYHSRGRPGFDKMRGVYAEAGFDVAFDGYPLGPSIYYDPQPYPVDLLQDSLDQVLNGHADLNDCRGCFTPYPGLDSLTLTRPDGAAFGLQAMDIARSFSAWLYDIEFRPETGSPETYRVPVPLYDLQFTGTRSDGSTISAMLSTFDGLTPFRTGPFSYGPHSLDLSGLGLTGLESLEIAQTVQFPVFDQAFVDGLVAEYGFGPDLAQFLSDCIAHTGPGSCTSNVPGLGRFFFGADVDTGQNVFVKTVVDDLHLSVGPAPVPLPAGAGLITAALVSLGLLRRRPRAA